MTVSESWWRDYAKKLAAIDNYAADLMQRYIDTYGVEDTERLIDYAFSLVQKYGDASSALACQCYDALAAYAGQVLPEALPASVASFGEVANAIGGALNQSFGGTLVPGTVSRLVKQASADTIIRNARRDGAEYAWVPVGDTCAFCIALAANGWQRASRGVRNGDHAEHIHANCDCTFAVRFSEDDDIAGYDPERYADMYYSADGSTPRERINAMRREFYAENRERINAQKRDAYARRQELESSAAEEVDV